MSKILKKKYKDGSTGKIEDVDEWLFLIISFNVIDEKSEWSGRSVLLVKIGVHFFRYFWLFQEANEFIGDVFLEVEICFLGGISAKSWIIVVG